MSVTTTVPDRRWDELSYITELIMLKTQDDFFFIHFIVENDYLHLTLALNEETRL